MSEEHEKHEDEETPTGDVEHGSGEMPRGEPEVAGVDSAAGAAGATEEGGVAVAAPPASKKRWYVVKVQSGREESIKNAIERRVKIEGLEEFVGRILIPTEKVTELSKGKRVVRKRKKFPGYLFCEVEFNDRVLYLFRETSGVGDFVGGSLHKLPTPMAEREVERMLMDEDTGEGKKQGAEPTKKKIIIPYAINDRVKVRDGTFKDMEGEVKEISDPTDPKENPKVKVVLTIWGRPVDVEVEYWQVDPV
jgi:transcriptional antiterminator NusG